MGMPPEMTCWPPWFTPGSGVGVGNVALPHGAKGTGAARRQSSEQYQGTAVAADYAICRCTVRYHTYTKHNNKT